MQIKDKKELLYKENNLNEQQHILSRITNGKFQVSSHISNYFLKY